jgi:hypothetical protein
VGGPEDEKSGEYYNFTKHNVLLRQLVIVITGIGNLKNIGGAGYEI